MERRTPWRNETIARGLVRETIGGRENRQKEVAEPRAGRAAIQHNQKLREQLAALSRRLPGSDRDLAESVRRSRFCSPESVEYVR